MSLLIVCVSSASLFSQTIINDYAKVLTRNDYQITVDNAADFSPGDYALIIQMKGVSILTDDTYSGYGNIDDVVGTPGQYEFIVIDNVVGNTISFLSRIKDYDPSGFVQIVKVPFFNSAAFIDKLTCQKWDAATGTGGVLALIVGGKLTLVNDIDVSGKGFNGATAEVGAGLCAGPAGISNIYSFPAAFDNAGFKGEGIASHYSPVTVPELLPYPLKGQGRLLSGGGGGNGRFSGGGGGSNRGNGSNGGIQDELLCNDPITTGGNGGYGITTYPALDPATGTGGVFMGGGGGSSTHLAGATATPGGHGGGIVFLLADSIDGNNKSILASGESALTATGVYSGAGGGGAGGSIVIFSDNYTNNLLNIAANGGKGGDVEQSFLSTRPEGGGVGGAGGGGYVALLKKAPLPSNISISKAGGTESFVIDIGNPDQPEGKGNEGGEGLQRTETAPVLTGFLFNSITSDVTGNQTDSICSNVPYSTITGTTPMGGEKGSGYIFVWQRSTVSGNDADFVTIPGAVSKDYSPGTLTQTTWFRRIVYDHTTPVAIEDKSKPVRIIVHQAIQNNTIVTTPDVLCMNGEPQLIMQGTPDLIIPSATYLKYIWEKSTDNIAWTNLNTPETAKEFDPSGGLTLPTWYRRTVISGRCIDNSGVKKIEVLPDISSNSILSANQDICYGTSFANLTASTASTNPVLSGGDGTYRFKWESNINNAGWGTAPGISNASDYNPVELAQRVPSNEYIYRRVVYSGANDVCSSVSSTVILKDYSAIINNTLSPVPIVCSGSVPAPVIGSKTPSLSGGNGIYTYTWEQSPIVNNWTVIPGATGADYQPPALDNITRYRRIVNSTCTSTSSEITVNVNPPVLTNNISVLTGGVVQEICNNQVPVSLQGTTASGGTGTFTYNWKYSPDNSVFNPVPGNGTGISYSPAALTATTYYKREVTSGVCVSSSNLVTVTVFPVITNNTITGDPSVCYSQGHAEISGSGPAGGSGTYNILWEQSTNGGTDWIPASLTNNAQNYQAPSLYIPTQYRRYVTSGANACCKSTSNILDISIDPLPGIPYAGPSETIFSIQNLYHMRADPPLENETGEWALISGSWDPDDKTAYDTEVRDLSTDKNIFSWTVTLGACSLIDTVTITLLNDFVPEGFSPNGDGTNDTFIIEGLDPDDNYIDLSIVNGAGTEVFATSNRSVWEDWNGKNSKGLDLPEGTYYYLLKLTPKDPLDGTTTQKKKGFIVLKRY